MKNSTSPLQENREKETDFLLKKNGILVEEIYLLNEEIKDLTLMNKQQKDIMEHMNDEVKDCNASELNLDMQITNLKDQVSKLLEQNRKFQTKINSWNNASHTSSLYLHTLKHPQDKAGVGLVKKPYVFPKGPRALEHMLLDNMSLKTNFVQKTFPIQTKQDVYESMNNSSDEGTSSNQTVVSSMELGSCTTVSNGQTVVTPKSDTYLRNRTTPFNHNEKSSLVIPQYKNPQKEKVQSPRWNHHSKGQTSQPKSQSYKPKKYPKPSHQKRESSHKSFNNLMKSNQDIITSYINQMVEYMVKEIVDHKEKEKKYVQAWVPKRSNPPGP